MSKNRYVKKAGFDVKTGEPRPLTEKEIKAIADQLVLKHGPTKEVVDLRNKQVLGAFYDLIREVRICPEAIEEFSSLIVEQHKKSLAEPGLAVGIIPGEAIGKVTQIALKMRHQGGSNNNVSSGLEILKELIDAVRVRKTPVSTIFLEGYPSRDEVVNKGREFVELKIEDLLEHEIPDLILRDEVEEGDNWWHELYLQKTKKKLPQCSSFYRLTFSLVKLYNYRLLLSEIAKFLEDDEKHVCIPSPFSLGYVDVFPSKKALEQIKAIRNKKMADYEFERYYFQHNFTSYFTTTMRGIRDIKEFNIKSEKLTEYMKLKKVKDGLWQVTVLAFKARDNFIWLEQFRKLFEIMGFKVPKEVVHDKYKPHYIFEAEEGKEMKFDSIETFAKENPALYEKYGLSWRIITVGSNLPDILCDPDIDRNRSYCNGIHETIDYLGVEPARTSFIRELYQIMKEGDLNSRHLELMADNFFIGGRYTGATWMGMRKRGANPMKVAAFQSAAKTLTKSALSSKPSTRASLTVAIATGQPIPVGSGAARVETKEGEELAALEKKHASEELLEANRYINPEGLTYFKESQATYEDVALEKISEDEETVESKVEDLDLDYQPKNPITYSFDINDFDTTIKFSFEPNMK